MLQDACERHVVEVALLVDGGLPEQLVHVLVREAVTHGGEQLPQGVLVDYALGMWGGISELWYFQQVYVMNNLFLIAFELNIYIYSIVFESYY